MLLSPPHASRRIHFWQRRGGTERDWYLCWWPSLARSASRPREPGARSGGSARSRLLFTPACAQP